MAKKRKVKKSKNYCNSKDQTPLKTVQSSKAVTTVQTILWKVCRLCENKDGPFTNIFHADVDLARKIDELLPIVVKEYDKLPHLICFRCSAKVEDLHEFVTKCSQTQENLYKQLGVNKIPVKSKTLEGRKNWEEKLIKTQKSNEEVCNELILKAMQGVTDIKDFKIPQVAKALPKEIVPPKKEAPEPKKEPTVIKTAPRKDTIVTKNEAQVSEDQEDNKILKQVKILIENESEEKIKAATQPKTTTPFKSSGEADKCGNKRKGRTEEEVMKHVTSIKVSGFGILYQCHLCSRNFLKKDVVLSHTCEKLGSKKTEKVILKRNSTEKKSEVTVDDGSDVEVQEITPETPPKKPGPASKTKNITSDKRETAGQSMGNLSFMSQTMPSSDVRYKLVPGPNNSFILVEEKPSLNIGLINHHNNYMQHTWPTNVSNQQILDQHLLNQTRQHNAAILGQTVTRGNIVGQHNTEMDHSTSTIIPNTILGHTMIRQTLLGPQPPSSMPTHAIHKQNYNNSQPVQPDEIKSVNVSAKPKPKSKKKKKQEYIIDLDETPSDTDKPVEAQPAGKPYPVGLFTAISNKDVMSDIPQLGPPTFTTPAMKKQSYSIVKTDNPHKLLLSTKKKGTEKTPEPPPVVEKGKRGRKRKVEEVSEQPYSVILEDTSIQRRNNDKFFTFINLDPLLKPSYVLPTADSIIQESQISTSTPQQNKQQPAAKGSKDVETEDKVYHCNFCNIVFTREKKLTAHMEQHYKRMEMEGSDSDANIKIDKKKKKKKLT